MDRVDASNHRTSLTGAGDGPAGRGNQRPTKTTTQHNFFVGGWRWTTGFEPDPLGGTGAENVPVAGQNRAQVI